MVKEKCKQVVLWHEEFGQVPVLKNCYFIGDEEFQTKNAQLVIDALVKLGFRRIEDERESS